jgi:hypothetical protein
MPAQRAAMLAGWASLGAMMLLGLAGPAVATECLRYAPVPVELVGTLSRQFVDRPPVQDLFVNPRDVEVEGGRPDSGFGGPQAAPAAKGDAGGKTAAPPPAATVAPVPEEVPPPPPAAAPAPAAAPPLLADGTLAADAAAAPLLPSPPAVTLTPAEPYGPPLPAVPTAIIPPPVKRPPPPEEIWVVQFAKPLCVTAERDDFVNVTEKKVVKMQIVGDTLTQKERLALAKKRVIVRGQLLHALMPRHYTPVLVAAEEIVLEQQAIAAMPGFGRQAPLE